MYCVKGIQTSRQFP